MGESVQLEGPAPTEMQGQQLKVRGKQAGRGGERKGSQQWPGHRMACAPLSRNTRSPSWGQWGATEVFSAGSDGLPSAF